jgi:hypothetical protein
MVGRRRVVKPRASNSFRVISAMARHAGRVEGAGVLVDEGFEQREGGVAWRSTAARMAGSWARGRGEGKGEDGQTTLLRVAEAA